LRSGPTYADWLREERDHDQLARWTLASGDPLSPHQVDTSAVEPWVDELNGDLHRQARAFAHGVPRPLGHCMPTGVCRVLDDARTRRPCPLEHLRRVSSYLRRAVTTRGFGEMVYL
jgi:hypothetical protein